MSDERPLSYPHAITSSKMWSLQRSMVDALSGHLQMIWAPDITDWQETERIRRTARADAETIRNAQLIHVNPAMTQRILGRVKVVQAPQLTLEVLPARHGLMVWADPVAETGEGFKVIACSWRAGQDDVWVKWWIETQAVTRIWMADESEEFDEEAAEDVLACNGDLLPADWCTLPFDGPLIAEDDASRGLLPRLVAVTIASWKVVTGGEGKRVPLTPDPVNYGRLRRDGLPGEAVWWIRDDAEAAIPEPEPENAPLGQVLDRFLAERSDRQPRRRLADDRYVIEILCDSIKGPQGDDGALRRPPKPKNLSAALRSFLKFELVRDHDAGPDLAVLVSDVIGDLVVWLAERGHLDEKTAAGLSECARSVGRDLPGAHRLGRLLQEAIDSGPYIDASAIPMRDEERRYLIDRVERGRFWVKESSEGPSLGPIAVPVEASELARPRWKMYASLVQVEGVWHLLEIDGVYP